MAAIGTVVSTLLQFWSGGVLDRHTEWRTATLELETTKAKAELGKANADIAKANAEIAEAKKQTAVLEKEAAEARLEQERLKQIVAWRALSNATADKLVEILSERKDLIKLAYVAADPEVLGLAIQFSKVLNLAKWRVFPESMTFSSSLVFDIRLPGPENETVELLRRAFSEAKIPFSTEEVPKPDMSFVRSGAETPSAIVFIGSKRPPF